MVSSAEANIDNCISFLRDLNAHDVQFFDRNILDHLLGTYEVLQSFNSNSALSKAGLFHAVYLTEFFGEHIPSPENRKAVREVAGDKAEQLAYFYCTMDRPDFIRSNRKPTIGYNDSFKRDFIPLSEEQDVQLVELIWANAIEQLRHLENPFAGQEGLKSLFEISRHRVGKPALTQYLSLQ